MLIVSNVINRLYPKLPLPFIQIVLGILVGVLAKETTLTLDSELFLALVIAPLNFREGQESDVTTLQVDCGLSDFANCFDNNADSWLCDW